MNAFNDHTKHVLSCIIMGSYANFSVDFLHVVRFVFIQYGNVYTIWRAPPGDLMGD